MRDEEHSLVSVKGLRDFWYEDQLLTHNMDTKFSGRLIPLWMFGTQVYYLMEKIKK